MAWAALLASWLAVAAATAAQSGYCKDSSGRCAPSVAQPSYCRGRPDGCRRVGYCEENPKAAACRKPPRAPAPDDVRVWKWPLQNYKMTRAAYGFPLLMDSDRANESYVVVRQRLLSWDPKAAGAEGLRYSVMTLDGMEHEMRGTTIPLFRAKLRRDGEAAGQTAPSVAPVSGAPCAREAGLAPGQDCRRVVHETGMTAEVFYYSGAHVVKRDSEWRMSPLVFDLPGRGVQTSERTTLFDVEGDGNPDQTQWVNDVAPGMGVLVFDGDGDGRSGENGRELFGDRTSLGDGRRFADGFQALRAFVELAVRDGVIGREALDRGRLDASALAELEKARGLKMKVGGFNAKPVSLARAGVAEIRLSSAPVERAAGFDGWDNDLSLQAGAVFRREDGSSGDYMDVWLATRREHQIRGELGTTTDAYLQ